MLETKRETVLDKGSFREVFPPTEADERIYRELEEENVTQRDIEVR